MVFFFFFRTNLKSLTYEEYPNTKHEMNAHMLMAVSRWILTQEKIKN